MGWFGESTAHKQARYQKQANEQLQQYNLENMEIQQGYNLQNMAQQFAYQQQAFQMENEYNSPLAQRQRMQAAGLNPNFSDSAIGQMDGGVSPMSPSGGASGSAAPPSGSATQDLVNVANVAMLAKQSQKLQSDISLNESMANKADSEARLNDVETSERPATYKSQRSLNELQGRYHFYQSRAVEETIKWIDDKEMTDIAEKISKMNLQDAQKREILDLLEPRLKNIASQTALNYSNVVRNDSEIWRNQQEVAQQWRDVQTRIEQVQVNRAEMQIHGREVDELIRNNKYNNFISKMFADANKNLSKSMSKYFDAGHKLITSQNVYQDIENNFRRYLRDNRIDSQTSDMFLEKLHHEVYNIDSETYLNQEEADNYQFQILCRALSMLGLGSAVMSHPKATAGATIPNSGKPGAVNQWTSPRH